MLLTYRVRNFKNIADAVENGEPLSFSPLTLIVGPNAVGKTSLLQSIDFLKAFFTLSIDEYLTSHRWEYVDLPNLRQTTKRILWDCTFRVPPTRAGLYGGRYTFEITAMKRRYLNVGQEVLTYRSDRVSDNSGAPAPTVSLIRRNGRRTRLNSPVTGKTEQVHFYQLPSSVATYLERSPQQATEYPEIIHFLTYIRKIRFASIFDVENLREPQRGYADELGPKGESLLPFLASIQNNDPDTFEKIANSATSLFGNITDVNIRGHNSASSPKILEVSEGSTFFNGKQVSDGFLRMLAIIALVYSDKPPSILLFEEPENGVHPRLLMKMMDMFRAMTQRKSPNQTQVLMTSHSPYLLDLFRDTPEAVYTIRRRGPRAAAEFRRLDHIFPNGIPDAPIGETWYADQLLGA